MGACISLDGDVSDEDKRLNRDAEKHLKEAKKQQESEVKVLLLGSGDSGKTTILKQMKIIHGVGFEKTEIEQYRQLVFGNITHGFRNLLDALEGFDLKVQDANADYVTMVENATDVKDGEPFPIEYLEPLRALWKDPAVQRGWERGNEAALPENLSYYFSDLDRLFDPHYAPNEQDILRCRARTTGIIETVIDVKSHKLHMLDVGGQKSERRKWIHCFSDVTSILFLVSLSGYDQCLVEDKDANQMQDAMAIWDQICHSQWFKTTSIILFLNKVDLFTEKIPHSHIRTVFPDYDGKEGDVDAGKDYFKKRFLRLSTKSNRVKEREIYIHFTTATDTKLLTKVMAAVEE
ncbi:heterotrimeric G protein alpha subunit 4 [Exidia glandulosa HHB12029]|uniref:Heterotrimeric G protein alpha subunit 4 n=1 Tax=Exidia glandulosa HHB12029 TaxID=1314781 RepID=A0A165B5J3_EXIGL|nr:heterotrimeric G protein alpha subunit 4 [Exidia glandulosa HHB12029]